MRLRVARPGVCEACWREREEGPIRCSPGKLCVLILQHTHSAALIASDRTVAVASFGIWRRQRRVVGDEVGQGVLHIWVIVRFCPHCRGVVVEGVTAGLLICTTDCTVALQTQHVLWPAPNHCCRQLLQNVWPHAVCTSGVARDFTLSGSMLS